MSLSTTQSRVFPRLSLWTATCYATRTMSLRTFSAALCFALLAPLTALAQLPTSGLTVKLGGKTLSATQNKVYINANQCKQSFDFTVILPQSVGGTSQIQVMELWANNDGSTD